MDSGPVAVAAPPAARLLRLLNGPRYVATHRLSIENHRMCVDCLQLLAHFQQHVRDTAWLRPKSRLRVRLFKVKYHSPSAPLQRSSCKRPLLTTVGIGARGGQSGQRVAHLSRQLVVDIDELRSPMSPIVLDFNEPSRIARHAEDIDRLRATRDGPELVAIERPFVVLANLAMVREREPEIAFFDLGHGMNSSTKRSDCNSSSSSRMSGSTPLTSLDWETTTPLSSRRSAK